LGKVFEAITKTAPAENRKSAKAEWPVPESTEAITDRTAPAPARPMPENGRTDVPMKRKKSPFADRVSALDDKLIAVNDSFSPAAEGFRRLRTKLLHPSAGKIPRSILITSVAPNEGKGFVAANLAITFAQGVKQHALLVDCDFRRPSLAGLFGFSNETGLADHLQDGALLSSLIRKTDIPKLSIIPAGSPPDNPSELLDSEKMVEVVDELTNRYPDRLVIFDSPPMQIAAETMVLAKHVDGVVLVVRWGGAGRAHVKKLAGMVGKEKLAGVVFNGVQINEIENRLYRYKGGYKYGGTY
jgi:protein-tyrosine kinase